MRNLLRIVPLLLLGIAAGCTIYSINPFCTRGKVVELKEVSGYWKLNVSIGEDVSRNDITPWKITDNTLITYDKNDKRSDLNITFFKLKDQLFADVGGKSSQNNEYWNITVLPMHVLLKVELKGDSLTLIPLNLEWFNKADNEKVKVLKSLAYDGNDKTRIYTSSSGEWESFLESNLNIPEMFNEKQKVVLQKIAAVPPVTEERK
ncbi:MAG: hypothetical protein WCV67_13845 [Victivallaceae bacterium]|jgi:hypothetical protein